MNKAVDKLSGFLFDLYSRFYREGYSQDEALLFVTRFSARVLGILTNPYKESNPKELKIINEYLKNYDRAFNLDGFGVPITRDMHFQAIKNVIEKWEEQAPPDKKRTKPDVVKIMQSFIDTLAPGMPVIDLACGTGTLVQGFKKHSNIIVKDINEKMVDITMNIATIGGHYNNFKIEGNYGDSISDPLPDLHLTLGKGVFIFDPPMGDMRLAPMEFRRILDLPAYSSGKIQSEILFLTKVLLEAKDGAYFIGLFPSNILNKNNNIYKQIRRELLEKSLISVIQVSSGHIILVGQKGLNPKEYSLIPTLKINKNFPFEKLNEFISNLLQEAKAQQNLLKLDNFDGYEIKVLERKALIEYGKSYEIPLPIRISTPEKIEYPVSELIEKINESEDKIKETWSNIKSSIENIDETVFEETEKEELLWFEKEENKSKVADSLCFFYRHPGLTVKYCYYKLKTKNLKKWRKFNIKNHSNLLRFFDNLLVLFESGHIAIFDNNFKICFDQEIKPPHIDYLNTDEYLQILSPLKWKKTEKIYSILDENTQKVYMDLSRYNILKCKEDTFLNNKELQKKEIIRALNVLKNIGLVDNKDSKEKNIDLYDSYIPYHYLTDEVFD